MVYMPGSENSTSAAAEKIIDISRISTTGMSSEKGKKIIGISFLICVLMSFGLGFYFGKTQIVYPTGPGEINMSLFWEAWAKLQDKYVDKGKFDNQKMLYGAISGMVDSLGDPYTVFMPPEEAKRFIDDTKGSFEGIGMEIGIRKNQLQVISPIEGTPAQRAGIRAGDIIAKIGDKDTGNMTVEEAVNLIRGQKGTEVVLTMFREEWEMTREIKVVRDVIKIPSLKLEFKEDGIAHMRLYQFSEKAPSDFRDAADEILRNQSKKIILDLRNNPGGYLEVSRDIASWFLEKGSVVAIEDFGGKQEANKYLAQGNSNLQSLPVVVLINKGSASASEILAGALRDNRNIKLIGETSFGKGSVQALEKLRGGSNLKITIAKWLTPNGYSISEKGLDPDVKVELTEEDIKAQKDPQLDKAIEILKELN